MIGKFNEQLKQGQLAEEFVLNKIKVKYPRAYRVIGYDKGKDIVVPEANINIEVKYDTTSKKTGNIAIEFEYNNELSGIATTIADYFALIYYNKGKKVWALIPTDELKKICKVSMTMQGGDYNASKFYFVRTSCLEKYEW